MKNQKKAIAVLVAFFLIIILFVKRKAIQTSTTYIMGMQKLTDLQTAALNLIIPLEGFNAKPHWDYKQWTWGYGTKVPNSTDSSLVVPKGTITKEQAKADLVKEIDWYYKEVQKVGVILNPLQTIAFISFGYNTGIGNMLKLLKRLKAGETMASVKASFLQYVNAGGVFNKGLDNRRKTEAKFL